MRFLDKVNCPDDLKKLTMPQLNVLACEMRSFLVGSISQTGGHLSSNLGIVELAMALHFTLDSPTDKIIWDVGHQCYPHKILTGRRDKFDTLRQYNGISGFVKSDESPHDTFDVGHSSTSLSIAHGMAVSRDLLVQSHKIAAVIGDGAMTSGLAWEAMNNIGRSNSDMLVVLNDNQMSISENVGALARHMGEIRTKPAYINVKRDVKSLLRNIPAIGERAEHFLDDSKKKLKYVLLPGVLFEELGFKYYGPVDGHNLRGLIQILQNIQQVKGPVFLHVLTKKGKGYLPAERESLKFHGIGHFDAKTGNCVSDCKKITYTDVVSNELVQLGQKNPEIVTITAAMPTGTGLAKFREHFPERFFDVGIAEGHAVTFAAGMAKAGLKPIVAIYSTFLQRAYDQIIHDVCIQKLPVIFLLDRSGLVAADGETHQGIYDISYLSHMPNMVIISPKNKREFEAMIEFAAEYDGPIAVRYPRDSASMVYGTTDEPIVLGKSETLEQGERIALVSFGAMMDNVCELYKALKERGFNPTLINARFAKPLDMGMVRELISYEYVFTFEENELTSGFGTQVMNGFSEISTFPKYFKKFGFPGGEFITQGSREQLFDKYGLSTEKMLENILAIIEDKQ